MSPFSKAQLASQKKLVRGSHDDSLRLFFGSCLSGVPYSRIYGMYVSCVGSSEFEIRSPDRAKTAHISCVHYSVGKTPKVYYAVRT